MRPATPAWLRQSASLGQEASEGDGLNKAFFVSVASDEQLVELLGFGEATAGPPTHRSEASKDPAGVQRSVAPAPSSVSSQTASSDLQNAINRGGKAPSQHPSSAPDFGKKHRQLAAYRCSPMLLPSSRCAAQQSTKKSPAGLDGLRGSELPRADWGRASSKCLKTLSKTPKDALGKLHNAAKVPPTNAPSQAARKSSKGGGDPLCLTLVKQPILDLEAFVTDAPSSSPTPPVAQDSKPNGHNCPMQAHVGLLSHAIRTSSGSSASPLIGSHVAALTQKGIPSGKCSGFEALKVSGGHSSQQQRASGIDCNKGSPSESQDLRSSVLLEKSKQRQFSLDSFASCQVKTCRGKVA